MRRLLTAVLHEHMERLVTGTAPLLYALARGWPLVLGLVMGGLWFQCHYAVGINCSPSLPYHAFLIHKGEAVAKGQFVAFRWAGGGPYPAGVTFVKIVVGMAGDHVTRIDRDYYVNDIAVGTAKTVSRKGVTLEPGPVGILPPGRYYVRAPHPDSLDSRYALTGWISEEQIIGRAYALF